jgi:hypothetical protein
MFIRAFFVLPLDFPVRDYTIVISGVDIKNILTAVQMRARADVT